MIPLVCIFSSLGSIKSQPGDDGQNCQTTEFDVTNSSGESNRSTDRRDVQEWQALVEKALRFFERMDRWSAAAKKSRDVLSRLYEASKILASEGSQQRLLAKTQHIRINDNSLSLGAVADSRTNQSDPHGHMQLPVTGAEMITEDIWGLSPNGAAAMNNFWFDDMMWDVPITDDDMFGNTGSGFAYSEFDWMAGLNPQGTGDQSWQFRQ
jgi:hypothetical protein